MARIGLAAFVVVMCALDVVWIRQNTAPPRMFDDSYYLIESVDLFHTLQDDGPGAFLAGTTVHSRRGHPPMMKILPTFMYPFLGPGVNEALYAYTVLIAVFCVYLFLLARELLDDEARALLAVVITCLFPITYGMWRQVMAEFGIAVAVVGCLYHLSRSQGFRHLGHTVAFSLFLGWGLLWKITFPVFVGGAVALVLFRSRRQLSARRFVPAILPALVVAGPFYARSWVPVVTFALFAGDPENQRLWGMGPVLSPLTIGRYWLAVINWGITPYFLGLTLLSWIVWFRRGRTNRVTRDSPLLLASFLPAFILLTFSPLKEVRHLLPVLPVAGIAMAGIVATLVVAMPRFRPVVLATLMMWPAYQFLSWSFDSRFVPRADLRWGPIVFSAANLETESLQWIPTYTYPANSTYWPSRETVQLIMSRLSGQQRARVHVTGTNPYFNALTLMHGARIARLPLDFDPPFTEDYAGSDFLVLVLANRHYGPVDKRPTPAELALKSHAAPFMIVGTLPLADGGTVKLYEADRRLGMPRPVR